MGLLDYLKSGLNDVAYQALGGPLLGDVLRDPTTAVTPQSLLAAANAGGGTPQQTPQTTTSAGATPATAAAWQGDDSQQQTPPLPGPQVGIPGAGAPAAAAAPIAPATSAPATADSATAAPLTSEDRVKQAMIAASNVLQQQPAAQWQPTKGEKGVMLRNLLGSIGGAMQAGLPIQAGVNQYRTATLNMLQMQQQAKQAAADQQVKQAFTAAMGAAGDDPRAQQAIITQFSAALPKDYMVGMADVYKAFKPPLNKPVGKPYAVVGPDGKPQLMQNYEIGPAQPVGTPAQLKAQTVDGRMVLPDGWLSAGLYQLKNGRTARLEENSGQFRIPGTNQPFDASQVGPLLQKASATTPFDQQKAEQIERAWATDHGIAYEDMTPAQRVQAANDNTLALKQAEANINKQTYLDEHPGINWGTPGSGGVLDTFTTTTRRGTKYLDLTGVTDAHDRSAGLNAGASAGLPVVTDKDVAQGLVSVDRVRNAASELWNQINQYLPKTPAERLNVGAANTLGKFLQTNNNLAAIDSFTPAATLGVKTIEGLRGFRMNEKQIQMAQALFPKATDNLGTAMQKLHNLNGLLNDVEDGNLVRNRSAMPGGANAPNPNAPAAQTQSAPYQPGGMFNGERIKSVTRIP